MAQKSKRALQNRSLALPRSVYRVIFGPLGLDGGRTLGSDGMSTFEVGFFFKVCARAKVPTARSGATIGVNAKASSTK